MTCMLLQDKEPYIQLNALHLDGFLWFAQMKQKVWEHGG